MGCRFVCALIVWLSLPTYGEENLLAHYRRVRSEYIALHGRHDPGSEDRRAELRQELEWIGQSIAPPRVVRFGPEIRSAVDEFVVQATLAARGISDQAAEATGERLESLLEELRAEGVAVDGLEIRNATWLDDEGREVEFPMLAGYEGSERDAEYVLIPLARGSEFGARYAGSHFGAAMEDLLAHNELARGRLRYVDPDGRREVIAPTFDRWDRLTDGLSWATGVAGGALVASAALAAAVTFAPAWVPAALGGLATALASSAGSLATFGLATGLASLGVQIKWNADRAMGGKAIDWAGLSFAAAGTALMGLGKFASSFGTQLGILAAGFSLDGAELSHGVRQARKIYRQEAPFLNRNQRMRLARQLVFQSLIDGATRVLFNLRLLEQGGRKLRGTFQRIGEYASDLAVPLRATAGPAKGAAPSDRQWNLSFQNSDSDSGSGKKAPPQTRISQDTLQEFAERLSRELGQDVSIDQVLHALGTEAKVFLPPIRDASVKILREARTWWEQATGAGNPTVVTKVPEVVPETQPTKKFFRFDAKFGWSELISVVAAMTGSLGTWFAYNQYRNAQPEIHMHNDFPINSGASMDPLTEEKRFVAFVPVVFSNTGGKNTTLLRFTGPESTAPIQVLRRGQVLSEKIPESEFFIIAGLVQNQAEWDHALINRWVFNPTTPDPLVNDIPPGESRTYSVGILIDAYHDTKVDHIDLSLNAEFNDGTVRPIRRRIFVPPAPKDQETAD